MSFLGANLRGALSYQVASCLSTVSVGRCYCRSRTTISFSARWFGWRCAHRTGLSTWRLTCCTSGSVMTIIRGSRLESSLTHLSSLLADGPILIGSTCAPAKIFTLTTMYSPISSLADIPIAFTLSLGRGHFSRNLLYSTRPT
jgi:hypothetical protein